jgi:putative ABC transport system substrate-binding protein
MRRRAFITLLGGAAVAWSSPAPAQQAGRTYRISFLAPFPESHPFFGVFLSELSRNGFATGRNLIVDPRGFGVPVANYDTVAAALVKDKIDAILPFGPQATRAAQEATRTIPIVAGMDDPIASNFVRSLSHPGGNLTGVGIFASQLDSKRLEILHSTVPEVRRIGILADPAQTSSWPQLRLTASGLGVELVFFYARSTDELVAATYAMAAAQVGAANILASPVLGGAGRLSVEQMQHLRLPAAYQWPETVHDGGLVAYGPRQEEITRQVVRQLVRVLEGEKPGDLPVEQPTVLALSVNLKTAKALGITVPQSVLVAADEVIE